MTTMTQTSARFREFKMPDVGEGLTEAEILKWFVQPGDTVTDGQVVCEVETAKAAVELPIPFDGVVHELRFAEGTTVDVGEVIITVDVAPGSEDAPAPAAAPPRSRSRPPPPRSRRAGRRSWWLRGRRVLHQAPPAQGGRSGGRRGRGGVQLNGHGSAAPVADAPPVGRPLAKPPVRKLAKDLGIDLATVVPTGKDGIITREDVHAAAAPASGCGA
ncbi:Dihydrolipoamide acetyltransferase component of pyruvate dehydrogenase complex OS=Streptomyces microflavus OX=1919 GN=Smic_38520 PE=3 SV=1 [Streptomyces microflavus]